MDSQHGKLRGNLSLSDSEGLRFLLRFHFGSISAGEGYVGKKIGRGTWLGKGMLVRELCGEPSGNRGGTTGER